MRTKLLFIACFLILNILKAQIITTIAGNGIWGYTGDSGQATVAELYRPVGIATDVVGNIYITDHYNNVIRKVDTLGIISTVAGNGTPGFSGDGGQATNAQLNSPIGLTVDAIGNLYIADRVNNRIRLVATSGIINTIAGNGTAGFSGDSGQANIAELNYPSSVTFDKMGNLYIADAGNHRIRIVNTSGIINTVVGNGTQNFSGDGGQATAAGIAPNEIIVDTSGNLYIADVTNYQIRKVNTFGIITTFAGNGTFGYGGDGGQATNAEFDPAGVCLDAAGNLYIADVSGHRIRKVNTLGMITTIAGDSIQGYSGDGGQATDAELYEPSGVALDGTGNLYVTDQINARVRKITNVTTADIKRVSKNDLQLIIYPNPANDKVYVEAKEIIEVKLFDLLGKEIISAKEKEIDVSNLNDGVYFIQVKTKENISTQKIIVE